MQQLVGGFTNYVDVAQVVLYAFWLFFAGLVFYLRREDKREGYPLVSETPGVRFPTHGGWPSPPSPKTFKLHDGKTYTAPPGNTDKRDFPLKATSPTPGSPFVPVGEALGAGVGPGAYALRLDEPDLTFAGEIKIVPLRVATDFWVEPNDPDPRGMTVVGADNKPAGTVADLWVDRSEPQIRYLEVALSGKGKNILLPILFADIQAQRKEVKVDSLLAADIAGVPTTKSASAVTAREEDRITAYFGGGRFYSVATRQEPLL